jgi:transposase InsO family protein
MSHANATLTPTGRLRLAKLVVDKNWPLRQAAGRFSVSVPTAKRWADRYRQFGAAGMSDRSSRPHVSPKRTPCRQERRIIGLRVSRRWGPHRIAYKLDLNPSTVHAVLRRYKCPRLSWTDPATGVQIRKPDPVRYEHQAPGDLIHVDIKKLGRIPDGGGWRTHGISTKAKKIKGRSRPGYAYLHHALDDHSRLVYSEELADEKKETAAAFWTRANAWFQSHGITVKRVLTDNGSCYRSNTFAAALDGITHKRTRPYRPQTNGKVERFNRTLLEEWAYIADYTSNTQRSATYQDWLHTYNHYRGHTSLKGQTPASRVTNLSGTNT